MNNFYLGIVEDRLSDPLKLGRVKVRVFGVHTEALNDIPTEDLPWAIPLMPAGSASLSGIGDAVPQYLEGSTVFLFFQDGDSKQQPIILGSLAGIPTLKDPLSKITSSEVNGAIVDSKSTAAPLKTQPNTGNVVTDSSGQPVTDSSGQAVQQGTQDNIPPLDISAMVAKFGLNVTVMYKALLAAGIKEPNALIAVLSNVAKETGYKLVREGLKYSSTARLRAIFPKYFSTMVESEALTYVGNEEKLANYVYAARYGNGPTASGDGYKYRGGGFIQLTFKSNYANIGSKIGVDLVSNPDAISTVDVAAKSATQFIVNAYGSPSRCSFSSLDEALTSVTKKVNAGGFANDYPKVVEYSKLCKIIEDPTATQTPEEKKAETAAVTQPNNPENAVDTSLTTEQVNASIKAKVSAKSPTGFKDPTGKYPITKLLNEQDVSRLARRNTNSTSVEKRNKNRITSIKSATGETFEEPAPAYNARYPYNKVHTTESGHTIEYDDTPGSERISEYHTSGTYTEIDKYGNTVNKIVGDHFLITERNGYVHVAGTARISVSGDAKIYVGGSMDVEVDGNLNYNIGGSVNWKIGGSSIQGIAGQNSIRSGSSTDIDSSMINLNSGFSAVNTPSSRGSSGEDFPRQIPENFLGAETLDFDDADEAVVDVMHQKQIASGEITQNQLDEGKAAAEKPLEKDTKEPPKKEDPPPTSCEGLPATGDIPDGTQISKYFTIGMLSTSAVVSHYKIAPQLGLKTPEIACNLKKLAENCLDPIKAKYPKMKVTSAFRTGTGTSQHCRGQAADMQFDGAAKGDYFTIAQWIRDNVVFDQLLLEYKTTGTGQPWIHISFNSGGNRQQVLTFMNDKTAAQGLSKLQG
jgi:putative chitinase